MIELKEVTAGYHKVPVIKNITVQLKPGEITAVIGPNGSGKSTLLKTVVDLCELYEGGVYLNGKTRKETGEREFARHVSYLSQIHAGGAISVSRMVLHGRFPFLDYPRRYGEKDYECCYRAMETTGILELKDRKVGELSGGQRQKVYLAMALAGDMEVFLFDEPTTYLDIRYQLEVLQVMKQLKAQKKAVAAVLHDLDCVMQIADQVIVLENGKTVYQGDSQQLWENDVIFKVFGVKPHIIRDEGENRHMFFEGKEQI